MNYTYLFALEPILHSLDEIYVVLVVIVINDVVVFETGSNYADQADLECTVKHVLLPPKYWE